jgi:hypothetical protein
MAHSRKTWPPVDSSEFIRSDEFAHQVLSLVEELATKYPQMDFADAVASLFTWLDQRLSTDPGFINSQRFPSQGAFRAYLRQAAWNVARRAARERQRSGQITELLAAFEPVSKDVSPQSVATFHECKDLLPPRLRRVFELWVEEECPERYRCDRLPYITSLLQSEDGRLNEREVLRLFTLACDKIHECLTGKQPRRPSRQSKGLR